MCPSQDQADQTVRSSNDASIDRRPFLTHGASAHVAVGPPGFSQSPEPHHGSSENSNEASTVQENFGSLAGRMASLRPTDRIYPIRSTISVDPTTTPFMKGERNEGYSQLSVRRDGRRSSQLGGPILGPEPNAPISELKERKGSGSVGKIPENSAPEKSPQRSSNAEHEGSKNNDSQRNLCQSSIDGNNKSEDDKEISGITKRPLGATPVRPILSTTNSGNVNDDVLGEYVTSRFRHIITEEGHAVTTGRDGETLQRCEDEPIHVPGAIQSFGLLIAMQLDDDDKLIVRVVSENSMSLIGYTPRELFALDSFCEILTEEQADNLLDHIDYIRDDSSDVAENGPEVFILSLNTTRDKQCKFWCAVHMSDLNPNLIICELEHEDDRAFPLVPSGDLTPEPPEDTTDSQPTAEEFLESTKAMNRPLRTLRGARKRKSEAAAMEIFNVLSQIQEQLTGAPNLEIFLKVLVGVVKELTGFHRVMIYQFDHSWNGKVVAELVDTRATRNLYKGLHFPASDIPKQARDLYRINKLRLLYDRDLNTARLVCRSVEDLETPLDLTHSYLRAMSPIHLKYLANMAVRSSMSISINAFGELWGLISCHSYGSKGRRVSFPIRKMCCLLGDTASQSIERLSFASRLQARKLINTIPTKQNPSGYIIASSEDLLQLFDSEVGVLAIRDETKILGQIDETQELLALVEYIRMKRFTSILTSHDVTEDFPDLNFEPGFKVIVGVLIVPLSTAGQDFIAFFRKAQTREIKWAGNPYEKFVKEGTEGYLEPRKSFKTWTESVMGKSREWTEDKVETAAILSLVYGKFIEVWRQKEAALKNSELTRLLLANSAHELRTPLNAIINYLEIALEGTLDSETRENLGKSHSASKSLIYVINDLLDLTKTEQGVKLVKGEIFELKGTLNEALIPFERDAKRKDIKFEVNLVAELPNYVVGDQRKVRQAVSNVVANAIQYTSDGSVVVNISLSSQSDGLAKVEVVVQDTGCGISSRKLDALFRELEQVQLEATQDNAHYSSKEKRDQKEGGKVLGLGLAVLARIIRNMDGQLRVHSEEAQGTSVTMIFPFELPEPEGLGNLNSSNGFSKAASSRIQSNQLPSVNLSTDERDEDGLSDRKPFPHTENSDSGMTTHSTRSRKTTSSEQSARSNNSDVDRIINAIREPHLGERTAISQADSRPDSESIRDIVGQRRIAPMSGNSAPAKTVDWGHVISAHSADRVKGDHPFTMVAGPGEHLVTDSGTPLRALKVKEDEGSQAVSPVRSPARSPVRLLKSEAHTPTAVDGEKLKGKHGDAEMENQKLAILRVLVAEDDPVNSKIVKKRLEKAGHTVYLTGNGEECASAYEEKAESFDVVLMDMQVSESFRYLSLCTMFLL